MENNFDIQIADNKQKIAAHDHTLGQAGFLPTIAASLSEDLDKQHGDIHSKLRLKPRANVVLNWTIFDGLDMFFTYKRLGKLRQLGELQAKKTIEDQVATIITAYYAMVLAQKKQAVLQKSLQLSEEQLQLAQANYEVGKSTQLGYLTAQVHYHEDQSKLLQQEEAVTETRLNLCKLLGSAMQDHFTVADTIPLHEKLTWDELTAALATHNEALLALQKRCDVATLELQAVKAHRFPQIAVYLGYSAWKDKGAWQHGPQGGITISLNLFEGFNFTREQHHGTPWQTAHRSRQETSLRS